MVLVVAVEVVPTTGSLDGGSVSMTVASIWLIPFEYVNSEADVQFNFSEVANCITHLPDC